MSLPKRPGFELAPDVRAANLALGRKRASGVVIEDTAGRYVRDATFADVLARAAGRDVAPGDAGRAVVVVGELDNRDARALLHGVTLQPFDALLQGYERYDFDAININLDPAHVAAIVARDAAYLFRAVVAEETRPGTDDPDRA